MFVANGFRILTSSVNLSEVVENCALLGYYTASSDNFLSTFRHNLLPNPYGQDPGFLTLRMGPDRMSRKVCKK